jgi:hypothetical protein
MRLTKICFIIFRSNYINGSLDSAKLYNKDNVLSLNFEFEEIGHSLDELRNIKIAFLHGKESRLNFRQIKPIFY